MTSTPFHPYLLVHVVKELLPDKARTCYQDSLHHLKVDMSEDCLYDLHVHGVTQPVQLPLLLGHLVVELGQSLFMLAAVPPPLPGDADIYLGPGDGHAAGHEADVGQALRHHHRGHVGRLAGVAGQLYPVEVHAVPQRLL